MQRVKGKRKNIGITKKVPEEAAWKKAVRGLELAWIVTLAGLLAGSIAIYWEWLDPIWIKGLAKGILLMAMFTGGFYIFRNTKGRSKIWTLIVLIAYLAIRFLLSLILTF